MTEQERQHLFQNTISGKLLASPGYMIILNEVESDGSSATWALYDDQMRSCVNGDRIRTEMVAAGFALLAEQDIDFTLNLDGVEGDQGTGLIGLYACCAPKSMSHDEIRQLLISHKPQLNLRSRLSIFKRGN